MTAVTVLPGNADCCRISTGARLTPCLRRDRAHAGTSPGRRAHFAHGSSAASLWLHELDGRSAWVITACICARKRRMELGAQSASTRWYVWHGHIKCKVTVTPTESTHTRRRALSPFSLSKCHGQLQPARAVAVCYPHSLSALMGISCGLRVGGPGAALRWPRAGRPGRFE